MPRTPNDFDDDFDDGDESLGPGTPRGVGPVDDLPLITPDMTDDLVSFIGDRWRADEENKPIRTDLTLSAALSKTPVQWLDAACTAFRINLRGSARRSRRARIESLTARLSDIDELAAAILEIPPHARAALRRVLDAGGWLRLSTLTRDFGDMIGDGWFWNEHPPQSSLGELRRRMLLFVGRAAITRAGKTGRKALKVAVIPEDLRAPLTRILADASVRREEEQAMAAFFGTPEDLLNDALDRARLHFDSVEWEQQLDRADVEGFLRDTHANGFDASMAWIALETILAFLDECSHEIRAIGDLAGYHVSELCTEFVDRHFLDRWALDERRELVDTVRRMFAYLHRVGRIDAEAAEEVDQACRQINSGKRRLNTVKRPPPLGGELIFLRANPNTGAEERFTINHLRLLMVWNDEFHQDWRTLMERCSEVPSGTEKRAHVSDLTALDPGICELLISRADEEDSAAAIHWFYEETLIALSAWS
jgi:DNA-directed RNA polymerase subunit F